MIRFPIEILEKYSKEQLLTYIRGAKRKMGILRKKMEHPCYPFIREERNPSDYALYESERDFLQMAIKRYVELGGEYIKNNKETKDEKFNLELEDIIKITFKQEVNSERKFKITIDLNSEEARIKKVIGSSRRERNSKSDKKSIIEELRYLHLGEWRKEYTAEAYKVIIPNEEKWGLEIEFKDKRRINFSGTNAYPYNYEQLIVLFKVV